MSESRLSNNHTCRGTKGEFVDICDELAGEYPKDFKFVGWHPHCRCHAGPILKTPEEMKSDNERIMRGEEPSEGSANEVKGMPGNFNEWMKDNDERIGRAEKRNTLPYFLKDNSKIIKPIANNKIKEDTIAELSYKYGGRTLSKPEVKYKSHMLSAQKAELEKMGLDVHLEGDLNLNVTSFLHTLDKMADKWGVIDRFGSIRLGGGEMRMEVELSTLVGTIRLNRSVRNNIVRHELLTIPTVMQNHGIGKALLRDMYKSYKEAGIDGIEIYANKTEGGYVWGKFGFMAKRGPKVLDELRKNKNKLTSEQWKIAGDIVDKYYETHDESEPFPMNRLAELSFGEKLMKGTGWDGLIDMTNKIHTSYFETHLFGKVLP